ncbi:MAG TPA: hypothetical protein PL059_14145 [Spirochaetota bacterium]|nr:hypothetical protein [Spirochaetota bacterium]HOM11416.1 hypothetical protein [Spirochaetota bacterium]HPP50094.1 hypothetical protein [Spirochaetota bacterium]
MKIRFFFLFLILFFPFTLLHAEQRLNFFIGDVKIEVNGKNVEPEIGMVLPPNAVIITGKRSQAHIFDTVSGIVTSIQPQQKITVVSLAPTKQNKNLTVWDKIRKEKHTTGIVTTAAVRGAEEGNVELEWDTVNEESTMKNDRATEWMLFGEKQYDRVISMTKNASDMDGVFLNAASTYYSKGMNKAEKVIPVLKQIIAGSAKNIIKSESNKILAAIYFEQGRFDLAWEHMNAAAVTIPENEISETGYYILAQSAFFTNRSDEGHLYLKKMKKYYKDSPLIEKVIER